jgi:lipid-A-disaccharide synthase-like uncharacterized protein
MALWQQFNGWMNTPFLEWGGLVLDPWKLIGYVGALMFALRWVVQALHRKRTGHNIMPTLFWIISLLGAGLTTLYFVFGKNDSVGIIQNALPATVALYNLVLDLRQRRASQS